VKEVECCLGDKDSTCFLPRFSRESSLALILDEATSHLDMNSIIDQPQHNSSRPVTGDLPIACPQYNNADLILVLDRGVLVESGTLMN